MPEPKFTVQRTNESQSLKLTFGNPSEGDSINVYLGEGELGVPELHVEGIILSEYTINNLIATKNYSVLAAFANDNFDESFTIDAEDSDTYTLTPDSGVTVTSGTKTFEVPWGDDLEDLDIYQIDNLTRTESRKSQKKVSIGENQTL